MGGLGSVVDLWLSFFCVLGLGESVFQVTV